MSWSLISLGCVKTFNISQFNSCLNPLRRIFVHLQLRERKRVLIVSFRRNLICNCVADYNSLRGCVDVRHFVSQPWFCLWILWQYPVQQHHPPTFENASIMIRETEEEDGFKLSRKESPDFRMNSLPPTSAIIPTHQVLIIDDAQLLDQEGMSSYQCPEC